MVSAVNHNPGTGFQSWIRPRKKNPSFRCPIPALDAIGQALQSEDFVGREGMRCGREIAISR